MNNLKIAQSHSSNRKWIAYLVAEASRLALIVNAAVVPLGLICVAFMLSVPLAEKILLAIPLGVIGGMLAVIVDGMTLGACARLRRLNDRKLAIEDEYAKIENPEPEIEKQKQKELASIMPMVRMNKRFLVVFTIISISGGELFWHSVFFALPAVLSWTVSSLFSVAVSTTLIASELLKNQNEHVILESIQAAKLHAAAFNADSEERAMSLLHAKFESKVSEIGENSMIAQIVEEKSRRIYDDILFGGQDVVSGLIEQESFAKEQAEVERQRLVASQRAQLPGGQKQRLQADNGPDTGPIVPIKLHDESDLNPFKPGVNQPLNQGLNEPVESIQGLKTEDRYDSPYAKPIESLYRQKPDIKPAEAARTVGCSYPTAKHWLDYFRPQSAN